MTETSGQLPFDSDPTPLSEPSTPVPGLHYTADWISPEAQDTLLSAIDNQPWSTQLKRRVQHYGQRYDYGSRSVAAASQTGVPPLPTWARQAATRLISEGLMDRESDQVIVNEYLPGQGISAHIDSLPHFGPVVAALSLGSGCLMDFTHSEDGSNLEVPLAPGSLLVMTGPARFIWRHAIAARKSDPGPTGRVPRGRRVSITFRTLIHPSR